MKWLSIIASLMMAGCAGGHVRSTRELAEWTRCKPARLEFWLARNIWYTKDGHGDQWKSAQRTLDERRGDCEDYAMVTSEVLSVCGYHPIILYGKHAWVDFEGGTFSNGQLKLK